VCGAAEFGKKPEGAAMKGIGWLAILPFIGMFAGPVFHNSVTPFIFGMPFILAWIVIWVLISSAVMAIIYRLDPAGGSDQ
jgi:hypothetical protein